MKVTVQPLQRRHPIKHQVIKDDKMKSTFRSLMLLPFALMSEAEAQNSAGAASAPTAETAAEARTRAAASNFLPIVRGRLPLIFVHAIRFDDVIKAMGNKDTASKFSTSVGKVFDVKKNSNFAYVNLDWKPTADDVAAAENWIAQVGAENAKGLPAAGDKDLLQKVLDQYKERGMASAEEAAAFSAARTSTRAPRAASAPKAPVATGEQTGQSAESESTAPVAQGSADALLS
jgi:hypothetical protein